MLKLEKALLIATCVILCLVGIFFIFEASALESFKVDGTPFFMVKNQLFGFVVGLAALIGASLVNVKFYLKFPYFFYIFALIIICLCFIPGDGQIFRGDEVINGSRRWIWFLGISVQVGEIVKFCLIVFFSYLLLRTKDYRVFLAYLVAPTALILVQKDLGTLLVIFAIAFGLYFLSGAPMKKMAMIAIGGLIAVILMIALSPYRRERMMTYLNPTSDPQDSTFHINQMLIAIGRGELIGKGIGQSRQKFAYVPEVSSDSIFSIVAEEIGFIGISLVFLLYMFFLYLIWRIVQYGDLGETEKMVGYGIFLLFLSQIFINLGGISGLIPLTGITLPFFSAGGSSLVISLFLVGVVVSLTRVKQTATIIRRRKYV